jgi:hypothetical protein
MTVREELHSTVKNRKSKNGGMKGAQWCLEKLESKNGGMKGAQWCLEKLEKQKWRYERSSMVP